MKIGLLLSIIGLILIHTACNNVDKNAKIDRLVIGLSGGDDPGERSKYYGMIAKYLEKEIGVKKVDIYLTTDYAAIIEGMRSKKVDIAALGDLSYIIAAERAGAEAIVMAGTKEGKKFTSSMIITSSKSSIKSMEDVKKRSKELSLAFGDPASTSGHLFPRSYLNSIGLQPEKSFKSISFLPDPTTTILTTISGNVDIACVYSLSVNRVIIKGKMKKDDYRLLWESEPYITTPLAVRGDLPDEMKQKIKDAYLNLPVKEPELWAKFKNALYTIYPDSIRNELIYIPSHDSLYNNIRKIARNCEGFNFLNAE